MTEQFQFGISGPYREKSCLSGPSEGDINVVVPLECGAQCILIINCNNTTANIKKERSDPPGYRQSANMTNSPGDSVFGLRQCCSNDNLVVLNQLPQKHSYNKHCPLPWVETFPLLTPPLPAPAQTQFMFVPIELHTCCPKTGLNPKVSNCTTNKGPI